jgi:hypothetical protein
MKRYLLVPALAVSAFLSAGMARAAELKGKVIEANHSWVKVQLESDQLPNKGDKVRFSFVIPGVEERADAGSGMVVGAEGTIVVVTLGVDARNISKNYEAVIVSDQPRRIESPQPSPNRDGRSTSAPPDSSTSQSQSNHNSGLPQRQMLPDSTRNHNNEGPLRPAPSTPIRDPDSRPSPPPDNGGTAFVITNNYEGQVFDGATPIAKIYLAINNEGFSLFEGWVTQDNYMMLIRPGDDGELYVAAFPPKSAKDGADGAQKDSRAKLQFDLGGKPGKGIRKLSGTLRDAQGKIYKFEARITPEP